MSLHAVAAVAVVGVADVAVEAGDVEVAEEVHVPVAAFPLRADPHARLDRAQAAGRAQGLGRAKAAAKRLRDLREVAHPVANRLPRDLREVVHPLRRVQHAPRAAQRVKVLRPDNVQLLALGRRTAPLAAVQPLVS
jgi:hypothetical protein